MWASLFCIASSRPLEQNGETIEGTAELLVIGLSKVEKENIAQTLQDRSDIFYEARGFTGRVAKSIPMVECY